MDLKSECDTQLLQEILVSELFSSKPTTRERKKKKKKRAGFIKGFSIVSQLCCVRFVYVQDSNVIARVLDLVLTRVQVSVLLRPSCCARSLLIKGKRRLGVKFIIFYEEYSLYFPFDYIGMKKRASRELLKMRYALHILFIHLRYLVL